MELIRSEAVDFFGFKLIKHVGIFKTKKIATLAEVNGIACVLIGPWETQVGIAAAIHLVLSSPNFNHRQDLGIGALKDDPTYGLHQKQGVIEVPTTPGLGVMYKFLKD